MDVVKEEVSQGNDQPMFKGVSIESIAKIAHEANKAYCETIGDNSQVSWDKAEQWQKDSAINGVNFNLLNPKLSPADSHANWMAEKTRDGWKYGPVKDAEKKEHPCYVEYHELPDAQKIKDYIFKNIVLAFYVSLGGGLEMDKALHTAKQEAEENDGRLKLELMKYLKGLRLRVDHILQLSLLFNREYNFSEENTQAYYKIAESKMYLGKILEAIGIANPYPESHDVQSAAIEKTADSEILDITKFSHLKTDVERTKYIRNEMLSIENEMKANLENPQHCINRIDQFVVSFFFSSYLEFTKGKMWYGMNLARIKRMMEKGRENKIEKGDGLNPTITAINISTVTEEISCCDPDENICGAEPDPNDIRTETEKEEIKSNQEEAK